MSLIEGHGSCASNLENKLHALFCHPVDIDAGAQNAELQLVEKAPPPANRSPVYLC